MADIISGTYYILNLVNGKIYNGSSWNVMKRLCGHKMLLQKNKHKNKHLQSAVNKYGIENFRFEIRDEIAHLWDLQSLSKEERSALKKALRPQLLDREQIWLDTDESHDREKGYNISPTAGSNLGLIWSNGQAPWNKGLSTNPDSANYDERVVLSRKKSGETQKGKKLSEKTKNRIRNNRPDQKGEKNPRAKLLDIQLTEIISKMMSGNYLRKQVAEEYNVTPGRISQIVSKWRKDNAA